jgi:hypothetical protein
MRCRHTLIGRLAIWLCWVVLLPAPALALDFSLGIEFDDGLTGNYGNVSGGERAAASSISSLP